jgi:hypothetical protein
VNEAQDIPAASMSLLLDTVEKIKLSQFDMIIFTAMESQENIVGIGKLFRALITRCYVPEILDEYSPDYRQAVLDYLEQVSRTQRLAVPNLKRIAEKARWSIRAALSALEMESMLANPDLLTLSAHSKEKGSTKDGLLLREVRGSRV